MKKNFFVFKILLYTFIFLGIFNSSHGKILEFNQDAKNISNYFSGLISFNDSDYVVSEKFLRKLSNFEDGNKNYPRKYIQSLINLQKFNEVEKYSKKLEKKNQSNFESNLFLGLYEFKEKNYDKALIYFKKLKLNYEHRYVFEILDITLNGWIEISKSKNLKSIDFLNFKNTAFNNIEIIQKTFAHCYIDSKNTEREFMSLLNNKNFNFSRYDFFISNYYFNKKDNEKALKLINLSKEKYPTNLLITQFKNTLIGKEKNLNNFNCKNAEDVLAETFYIIANALSSSENYRLSNFYVNLSKFLNPDFLSYNILLAENLLALKKYENAKKTYKNLFKVGTFYKWYSAKRIAMIMEEKKETNSINFLSTIYSSIDPGDYQIYDYANFLRNKEKYKDSIKLYSEILKKINKDHELYPEILERRGMAYERSDNWDLAEKDLLKSLEIKPKDAYVMNYLAYSWIEKNKNIDKSLKMLKEANDIERNSGYITDSLGWALFKSKKFLESKKYLEIAIMLMPKDPVISDHYADCLWMNDFKIQARYYWNSVLKSDDADIELKNKVKDKILFGLKNI
tara:strand:- start:2407 stop:4107 length:1701 start_codon:yes stop_codon:yes gene_type:complete